jgi:hypothetical protein
MENYFISKSYLNLYPKHMEVNSNEDMKYLVDESKKWYMDAKNSGVQKMVYPYFISTQYIFRMSQNYFDFDDFDKTKLDEYKYDKFRQFFSERLDACRGDFFKDRGL